MERVSIMTGTQDREIEVRDILLAVFIILLYILMFMLFALLFIPPMGVYL